jgi:hypothetical protein
MLHEYRVPVQRIWRAGVQRSVVSRPVIYRGGSTHGSHAAAPTQSL